MTPDPQAQTIPAATLVLMRPGPIAPELLMVERAARMAFAPGALVFPGGRIDADDWTIGRDRVDAARVAAIRETLEETGIAVAMGPVADDLARDLRAQLSAGALLSDLLRLHSLALRLDVLVPFARWCPTFRETRNFDTHFFVALAPADAPPPVADAGESARAFWTSARDVLDHIERGEAQAIFPTRRNLERLARFASFQQAADDAAAYRIDTIIPQIEQRRGKAFLCIPEGRGYPVTAEPLETARRF